MRTKIEITADGSHTIFVPELDEHYHSVNGAVQESMHVFIDSGLTQINKKEICIFEVGFGTGLNAYLTALQVQNTSSIIHYTSIESYPLPIDVVQKLNYSQQLKSDSYHLFLKLHEEEWNKQTRILPNFYLNKIEADFTSYNYESQNCIDIVYFDAFAPDKQSDMWSQEIFNSVYSIMSLGGVLVTYCAKGVVRRMMQQAGFVVERLPGPPGKREMLRATKQL